MNRILFFLFVTLFSTSFAFADNVDNEDNEVKAKAVASVNWATITVDYEDITYPWTISFPAPEAVISSVNWSNGPSYIQWYAHNGIMYVTMSGSLDIQLREGGYFSIVLVGENTSYYITIEVNI